MRALPSLRRIALAALAGYALLAPPAQALDLNSFRRAHRLPPLHYSAAFAGAAAAHARDLAARDRLDHAGFKQRMGSLSSTAAENVLYGCTNADCAFKMWSRSSGHRRNMLMKGVTHYGLADAVSASGKHYWVLELGN
jgi:uncharacterized protein YkwD